VSESRQESDTAKQKNAKVTVVEPKEGEQEERRISAALSLLNDTVDQCRTLENPEPRAALSSRALELLWRYDEQKARAVYGRIIDELISSYEAQVRDSGAQSQATDKFGSSLIIALRSFSKLDAAAAAVALRKYHKIRTESIQQKPSSTSSLAETLSLAKESLGMSTNESVAIASAVLDIGVPSGFPQYLNDLRNVDSVLADTLFRKALAVLSGRTYSPVQAIFLSAYPFDESPLIYPVVLAENGKYQTGTVTMPLIQSQSPADASLPGAYLDAAWTFLAPEFAELGTITNRDTGYIAQCFFLTKKLTIYAAQYGLDPSGRWALLDHNAEIAVRKTDVDPSYLAEVEGYAQRLATHSHNLFQLDSGAAELEQAGSERDPQKRRLLIACATVHMTFTGKYLEAQMKLRDIDDLGLRQQIADYVNFQASRSAIESGDWSEVSRMTANIESRPARVLILLEAASAAVEARSKEKAIEYATDALSLVPKFDDKNDEASALVAAASILFAFDPVGARQALSQAKNAINRAPDYKGSEWRVNFPGPECIPAVEGLRNSTIDYCFNHAAKDDWFGAIGVANDISSKELRLRARIAACMAVVKVGTKSGAENPNGPRSRR
jgi:hypothetical protein